MAIVDTWKFEDKYDITTSVVATPTSVDDVRTVVTGIGTEVTFWNGELYSDPTPRKAKWYFAIKGGPTVSIFCENVLSGSRYYNDTYKTYIVPEGEDSVYLFSVSRGQTHWNVYKLDNASTNPVLTSQTWESDGGRSIILFPNQEPVRISGGYALLGRSLQHTGNVWGIIWSVPEYMTRWFFDGEMNYVGCENSSPSPLGNFYVGRPWLGDKQYLSYQDVFDSEITYTVVSHNPYGSGWTETSPVTQSIVQFSDIGADRDYNEPMPAPNDYMGDAWVIPTGPYGNRVYKLKMSQSGSNFSVAGEFPTMTDNPDNPQPPDPWNKAQYTEVSYSRNMIIGAIQETYDQKLNIRIWCHYIDTANDDYGVLDVAISDYWDGYQRASDRYHYVFQHDNGFCITANNGYNGIFDGTTKILVMSGTQNATSKIEKPLKLKQRDDGLGPFGGPVRIGYHSLNNDLLRIMNGGLW